MLNIRNGIYKSIPIKWDTITFPLKAGTPVSIGGTVTNSSSSMGIVPTTYPERPLMEEIYILVGGDVIQAECEESWGDSYEDDAFAAMDGIRFYTADGTPVDCACGGDGGSGSDVFVINEDMFGVLDKTGREIVNAFNAGKAIILKAQSSIDGNQINRVEYFSQYIDQVGFDIIYKFLDTEVNAEIQYVSTEYDEYPHIVAPAPEPE